MTLTMTLGKAYISVLKNIFKSNPDSFPGIEDIALKLQEKMQKK